MTVPTEPNKDKNPSSQQEGVVSKDPPGNAYKKKKKAPPQILNISLLDFFGK